MPADNRFQHQPYPTQPVITPEFRRLRADVATEPSFLRLHADLRVREVILVHGTFMGNDGFAIGDILESLGDSLPPLKAALRTAAEKLRARLKETVDSLTRDVGNYTAEYQQRFQELVGTDPLVRRLDPPWSGQNHHFARADLAVRLLCLLDDLQPQPDERILFWGHSHAGNAFALLSNLLANDRPSVDRFFAAAQDRPSPQWQRARELLKAAERPHPFHRNVLVAAFGTPVRYGWDVTGLNQLVHVLHHRNYDPEDPFRTHPLFPPHSLRDTLHARYGDWVQAFAIAGTDIAPPTARKLQARFHELLEGNLTEPDHKADTRLIMPQALRNLCQRWKTGTRCHTDGLNLLVEYEPCGRTTRAGLPIEESMFGHGVATTIDWLPAHLALVSEALQR